MNPMDEENKTVFEVDKDQHCIHVIRKVRAPLSRVWRAWTEAELLEKWFGPKPFQVTTLDMDFREGGKWTYRLDAEGQETQWGRTEYHQIVREKFFTASDLFLDQEGRPIPGMPRSRWRIDFSTEGQHTLMEVDTRYPTKEDLENMMAWGYSQGFQAVMQNLDELLARPQP